MYFSVQRDWKKQTNSTSSFCIIFGINKLWTKPVIAIFADHLLVPSNTLCLTAFIWPAWLLSSTPNTALQMNREKRAKRLSLRIFIWHKTQACGICLHKYLECLCHFFIHSPALALSFLSSVFSSFFSFSFILSVSLSLTISLSRS